MKQCRTRGEFICDFFLFPYFPPNTLEWRRCRSDMGPLPSLQSSFPLLSVLQERWGLIADRQCRGLFPFSLIPCPAAPDPPSHSVNLVPIKGVVRSSFRPLSVACCTVKTCTRPNITPAATAHLHIIRTQNTCEEPAIHRVIHLSTLTSFLSTTLCTGLTSVIPKS